MSVRLKVGTFHKVDGGAFEDFEVVAVGSVTSIPEVVGNAGCILRVGSFAPRL